MAKLRGDGITVDLVKAQAEEAMPDGSYDFSEKFKQASLATGAQTVTLSLSKGTVRAIREVIITVGDLGDEWGSDGYFEVHRTNSTPTSSTKLGESYMQTSNIITFDKPIFSALSLKLVINHAAGTSKDVRIVVKYWYK